ncbi:MAG TPA: polysaccharide deacetylase family protein [Rubrivivax sp.]|nr:polysaccharide deacetylase family protein [Rubrivivax sp.]
MRSLILGMSLALVGVAQSGCSVFGPSLQGPREGEPGAPPSGGPQPVARATQAGSGGAGGEVIGRSERLIVYLPRAGDTLAALAARFLGRPADAWQIAEANALRGEPVAGQALVIPLAPRNTLGITASGVQTVPVLCYHRLGTGHSKMIISPAKFEEQMAYLANSGYHVVRLSDLRAFMAGERPLPAKSVVISFDDGYESVYRHAFPILKKYNFPATLFMYSDFIGARDALTWWQLDELARSGLVDLQAHSKTHRNLTEREPDESEFDYRKRVDLELRTPREVFEKRMAALGAKVRHFAYPYGSANDVVLEAMQRADYELGLTVNAGGNPFFASPLMLRRTMIYGDHSLADFQARLQVQRSLGRP